MKGGAPKRYEEWNRRRDANAEVLKEADDQVLQENWWRFYHSIAIQTMNEIPEKRWREIVAHALAEETLKGKP